MTRAVTLLTLDVGSVLYNPAQMPGEIVLKHTDGDLIKTRRSEAGKWRSLRREEFEVNFWEDGKYDSPITAVASLADRQAFGFRLNGEAVNPLLIGEPSELPETIEIEGLHRGGIMMEDRIDEHQELFKASYSEADDEIRERMAIQNDTAFSPSSPLPRSVEFPSE